MSSDIQSRLAHMPVALFTTVMGTGGLTLAWKKSHDVLGVSQAVGDALLLITAIIMLIVAISYLAKIRHYPNSVLAEFNHPIKVSFFSAFSIGLMLIATGLVDHSESTATFLWALGSLIHLALTLTLMNLWIHHARWQVNHTTPAWFMPFVGNIVVPLAGAELGYTEISWFFFSIGIFFWIILKTLIFNRMVFHDPLPDRLLPTLFIMIAPPSVGFISYVKLNGDIDNFANILYYLALFLVMLLTTQIRRFTKLPFFVSWWAYSFPIAAFTVASLIMYQHTQKLFFYTLCLFLLTFLSLLLAMLVFKTIRGLISGALLQPE